MSRTKSSPTALESIHNLPDEEFELTSINHLRHGTLYTLLKAAGMTYAEGAKALGLSVVEFGDMVRLKRLPSFEGKRGEAIARRLEALTGIPVKRLFPAYTRTGEFLRRKKTVVVTRTVSTKLLASTSMVRSLSRTGEGSMKTSAEKVAFATEMLDEVLSDLTMAESQQVRAALYKKWRGPKALIQNKPHGMVISIP